MARKSMIGGQEQLYKGLLYKRKSDTMLEETGQIFYFEYTNDKGNKSSDIQLLTGRITRDDSIEITSDTQIDFQPDDEIVINQDKYNISTVQKIRNSAYDMRAANGISNISFEMSLDTA